MVHIARQPILKADGRTFGYELLYRNGQPGKNTADVIDGNKATCAVISNSMTVFGMQELTNNSMAFINFTRELLMGEYLSLMTPDNLIVEILEDIVIDPPFVRCIQSWAQKGYHFAVDDYNGATDISALLPYVEIVKVDFMGLSQEKRLSIAQNLQSHRKQLLAEKVETAEDYAHAKKAGYTLFQGYYFERPELLQANLPSVQHLTSLRVFNETSRPDMSFDILGDIIRADMALTYKLLRHVSTLQYYRGHAITDVKDALVRMGTENVRRWMMLGFLREMGGEENSEMIKSALVRAVFCEKIAGRMRLAAQRENAYFCGLFSVMESKDSDGARELFDNVTVPDAVKKALIERKGVLYDIIGFAKNYQSGKWEEALPFLQKHKLAEERVAQDYREAVQNADKTFGEAETSAR